MNRYWTRIGFGALLVFCLGMVGISTVRKAKAKVGTYLATVGGRLPMRLATVGFQLDGRRLGDLTGLDIQRSGAGDPGNVTVRVQLTDAADAAQLESCTIAVDRRGIFNDSRGFTCESESDLTDMGYVQWGNVVFEPGNLTRPIYVSRHDLSRWNRTEIRSLQATMARGSDGRVRAEGKFDLVSRRGDPTKGSFNLTADDRGAMFSVRDNSGRSLVDFRADEGGINLNIHDRNGRNLVKPLADSLGAALSTHR